MKGSKWELILGDASEIRTLIYMWGRPGSGALLISSESPDFPNLADGVTECLSLIGSLAKSDT